MKRKMIILAVALILATFTACGAGVAQPESSSVPAASSEPASSAELSAPAGNPDITTLPAGRFRLDGSDDTTYWDIESNGSVTGYYASGTLEFMAVIETVEQPDGTVKFEMYTMDDRLMNELYFDSATQFRTKSGKTFIKE